jgi:hypothetical protein
MELGRGVSKMEMATVQQIAVAFSAVVATLIFIYKVIDDRRSRTEKDILDWQKTVVHQFSKRANRNGSPLRR